MSSSSSGLNHRSHHPNSLYLQRKDGTRFHAEISSSVLTGADGRAVGMISILRNVTDRIAADDALRKAGAKLNLLSSVTRHDILNQLTVLIGYIELARRAKDPAVVQDFLRKIDEIAGMLGDQIGFTKDYQELGVHSPCWQCIPAIISQSASGLGTGDVKIVSECAGLEDLCRPPAHQGRVQPDRQRPAARGIGQHHPVPVREERG